MAKVKYAEVMTIFLFDSEAPKSIFLSDLTYIHLYHGTRKDILTEYNSV